MPDRNILPWLAALQPSAAGASDAVLELIRWPRPAGPAVAHPPWVETAASAKTLAMLWHTVIVDGHGDGHANAIANSGTAGPCQESTGMHPGNDLRLHDELKSSLCHPTRKP